MGKIEYSPEYVDYLTKRLDDEKAHSDRLLRIIEQTAAAMNDDLDLWRKERKKMQLEAINSSNQQRAISEKEVDPCKQ